MDSLEQMLEDYRNGERGLPSYEELLVFSDQIRSVKDSLYTIRQAHCLSQYSRIGFIVDEAIANFEGQSC
jgi:hypothetical protein